MGIFFKKKLNQSTFIGIWDITESIDELYDQLQLNADEKKLYDSFRTNQRRSHWLSYRVLINSFLGKDTNRICYDENGKPFLNVPNKHISITHSGRFSALIIGDKPVGIDIEQIKSKITNISEKFMSSKELAQVDASHQIEQLYVYWGAKEALYKLFGKKNLQFNKNINIKEFPYKQKDKIQGSIITPSFKRDYTLYYEYIEDYSLVYVTE